MTSAIENAMSSGSNQIHQDGQLEISSDTPDYNESISNHSCNFH